MEQAALLNTDHSTVLNVFKWVVPLAPEVQQTGRGAILTACTLRCLSISPPAHTTLSKLAQLLLWRDWPHVQSLGQSRSNNQLKHV